MKRRLKLKPLKYTGVSTSTTYHAQTNQVGSLKTDIAAVRKGSQLTLAQITSIFKICVPIQMSVLTKTTRDFCMVSEKIKALENCLKWIPCAVCTGMV